MYRHDPDGLQLLRQRGIGGAPLIATCYYLPRFAARYLTWNDKPQESIESILWVYSIWLFNQFDHAVFATETHRDACLREGLETLTTIISNGVDTMRYHPPCGPVQKVEARYDLADNARILSVSRLAKEKEIEILNRGNDACLCSTGSRPATGRKGG